MHAVDQSNLLQKIVVVKPKLLKSPSVAYCDLGKDKLRGAFIFKWWTAGKGGS